jgi:hypothetical protein
VNETQHGYLVIADISGYTSFVAGTELEHSHEILSDLLATIYEKIESLLIIHKLEGDAIFAYAPATKVSRGETLLELIESTYAAFRDKQVSMKRTTTCTCRACQNIPSLDLKFIAHHGEYIMQQVRGVKEMVGSDVNLLHRLLKNHVTESTGWRAYLMFTEKCLDHLNLNLEEMLEQAESYEYFDKVKTFNLDLNKRYQEMLGTRRIFIDKHEADIVLAINFNVPLPVAWDWIQDPVKRNLWGHDVVWSIGQRPRGRMGNGASNHCAHGKGVLTEVVLDWHPFEYSTTEAYEGGKKSMTETFRFEPLSKGGTRVYDIMKIEMPLPRPIRRLIGTIYVKSMKMEESIQNVARLAEEDYKKTAITVWNQI